MPHKWIALFTFMFLLTGCDAERNVAKRVSDNRGSDSKLSSSTEDLQFQIKSTSTDTIAADVEKLIWRWFDANIGSQERLAQSTTGQRLSGGDIGNEIQLSQAQQLLFTEQLNLLVMIRDSRNTRIAQQYMLVHTLMTIDQAESTQSLLGGDDPRRVGVTQQIKTARQLLAAIGYEQYLKGKE